MISEKICFVLGSIAPWKEMKNWVPLLLTLIWSNSESCSHTETRLFVCSVEVKICKVLCFFYFKLWLIIRQLSMACKVDESRSFDKTVCKEVKALFNCQSSINVFHYIRNETNRSGEICIQSVWVNQVYLTGFFLCFGY